jgi:hypothetical protein
MVKGTTYIVPIRMISCTKIDGALMRDTVYKDRFVELGKRYRYAVKAVKQNRESGPSNVVEVFIPLT